MGLQTSIFNRNVHNSNSSSLFVTIEFIKKIKIVRGTEGYLNITSLITPLMMLRHLASNPTSPSPVLPLVS